VDRILLDAGYRFERLFVPPLQSVWVITAPSGERRFIDAKTGQELPDLSSWADALEPWSKPSMPGGNQPAKFFQEIWEAEDPFLRAAWLRNPPLEATDFPEWVEMARLKQGRLVYYARLFGGIALYPLSVSGYMAGPGLGTFIRLDHDGARYIAYDSATAIGQFHS